MAAIHHNLDAEELFHLAVHAMSRNEFDTTISNLKRSLELKPEYPQAHYMLGVAYAQIGMGIRAIEELRASLELEPTLDMARFQLGLFLMSAGDTEDAIEVWKPLDHIGEQHPLYLFKMGLVAMSRNEFDDARKWLNAGIGQNTVNPALNQDMQSVISRIDQAQRQAQATEKPENPAPVEKTRKINPVEKPGKVNAPQHMMVSAYKNQKPS